MEQDPSTGSSVLISCADGTPFTTVNPFSIAAHIRQLIEEVQSAKPARGGLLINYQDHEHSPQTATLVSLRDFMGRPATACMDQQSRGLRSRGQERNLGLRIRFRGPHLPKQLWIGFDELKIRRWTDSPKLCGRCADYGHRAVHCGL